MNRAITVRMICDRLQEPLQLEVFGGDELDREVPSAEISSPGLALAGYVERFAAHRLQVLGETEITYLRSLAHEERERILRTFFGFPIPCVFVTKGLECPDGLREIAEEAGVPIIRSRLKTYEFYRRVKPVLEELFAPSVTLHGSLADVFGVGLLFVGRSGIGKSECVLDLVERGHRLVADDIVLTTRRGNDVLIGRGHEMQRHHMEVRGVGLIDIPAIFGVRAVRQQKRIEVVVQLEEWNQEAVVERTGLERRMTEILGVELPKMIVPLNPGKNITVIAEVVAMNHLLRYAGVDTPTQFNERLIARMQVAASVRQYLQEDDE